MDDNSISTINHTGRYHHDLRVKVGFYRTIPGVGWKERSDDANIEDCFREDDNIVFDVSTRLGRYYNYSYILLEIVDKSGYYIGDTLDYDINLKIRFHLGSTGYQPKFCLPYVDRILYPVQIDIHEFEQQYTVADANAYIYNNYITPYITKAQRECLAKRGQIKADTFDIHFRAGESTRKIISLRCLSDINNTWSGITNIPIQLFEPQGCIFRYQGKDTRLIEYCYSFFKDDSMPTGEEKNPILEQVYIPDGVYYRGMSIPIVVRYSEAVYPSYAKLEVNSKVLSAWETGETISSFGTFFYVVGENDETSISIHGIQNIVNVKKKTTERQDLNDWDYLQNRTQIISVRMVDAVKGMKTEKQNRLLKIQVLLDNKDKRFRNFYLNDRNREDDLMIAQSAYIYITADKISTRVPLSYVYEEESKTYRLEGKYEIPYNLSSQDRPYMVELMVRDTVNKEEEEFVMVDPFVYLVEKPVVFAKKEDITLQIPKDGLWPSGNQNEIKLDDPSLVTVLANYTGNATYHDPEDFMWVTTPSDVAEVIRQVSTTGEIEYAIYPKKPGEFQVGLMALNGMLDSTRNITKYYESNITVRVGEEPIIQIPLGLRTRLIQAPEDMSVVWIQNLTYINKQILAEKKTVFKIDLYLGNYSKEQLSQETPIYSVDGHQNPLLIDTSTFTIPYQFLTGGYSIGDTPVYTIKVESENPYTGEKISAIAYGVVRSKPAVVSLEELDTYYYMDIKQGKANSVELKFTLAEYDNINEGEFLFVVEKNGIELPESRMDFKDLHQITETVYEGSYVLTFQQVSDSVLNTCYTIRCQCKNKLDRCYSYDSVLLYVYNSKALQVRVNGNASNELTLSNREWIAQLDLNQMESKKIQELRENVSLTAEVSINYNDYPWSEERDVIRWESSDWSHVSVNLPTGAGYQNLKASQYEVVTPYEKLLLVGTQDSEETVRAIHDKTNHDGKVSVKVKTLYGRLFLFLFEPAVRTFVTYVNGENITRNINSNDEGMLAIYEETGIQKYIYLKSQYIDHKQGDITPTDYVGTIDIGAVLSGEVDVTQQRRYPINQFTLYRISKVHLYFKTVEGTPYEKKISIYGGVYKNGGYCQDALLNDISGIQGLHYDKINDGHLEITMDQTQFWSKELGEDSTTEINLGDRFQFIFEVHFEDISAYPMLLIIDGKRMNRQKVKFSDAIVWIKNVSVLEEKQPFIAYQTIRYGGEQNEEESVIDFTGAIGASADLPQSTLSTSMLLWGIPLESADQYEVIIADTDGVIPESQICQTVIYPFSQNAILLNKIIFDKDTIWFEPSETKELELILEKKMDSSGPRMKQRLPFQVMNLTEEPGIEKTDKIDRIITNTVANVTTNGVDVVGGDSVTQTGVFIMGKLFTVSPLYRMYVTKSKNVNEYLCFGWMGKGESGFPYIDNSRNFVVNVDVAKTDLSTKPTIADLKTIAKRKNMSEVKKALKKIKNQDGKKQSSFSVDFDLNGYALFAVASNPNGGASTKQLEGGFTGYLEIGYTWTKNLVIEGIPVTITMGFEGGIGLDFCTIFRTTELEELPWENPQSKGENDYKTTLLLKVGFKIFAGLGFDYSAVVIKAGVFGEVDAQFQSAWLNRGYLKDKDQRKADGQYLSLSGTIGARIVLTILFISFKLTILSVNLATKFEFRKWKEIQKYWNDKPYGPDDNGYSQFISISTPPVLEDRTYLANRPQIWRQNYKQYCKNDTQYLVIIEENSYPNARPVVTRDGMLLGCISDQMSLNISDTRAAWSIQNSQNEYVLPTPFPEPRKESGQFMDYGNCQLSLDGEQNFAVAAWIRMSDELPVKEGATVTLLQQHSIMNSADIMMSTYENGVWESYIITDNGFANIAPNVCANEETAFLVYRSSYSSGEAVNQFINRDLICYRSKQKGRNDISEEYELYNGTNGGIRGLKTAILSNNTKCVVYGVEVFGDGTPENFEIMYAIIDENDSIKKTVRLTNNHMIDENPQITVVTFDGEEEYFVIGWHQVEAIKDDKNEVVNQIIDLCLAVISSSGERVSLLPDSLGSVLKDEILYANGQLAFAKVPYGKRQVDNLYLLWVESALSICEDPNQDPTETMDHDELRGVKFYMDSNQQVRVSSSFVAVTMPDRTSIDSFEVVLKDEKSRKLSFLIEGGTVEVDPLDVGVNQVVMDGDSGVNLEDCIYNEYEAVYTLHQDILIASIEYDYEMIDKGAILPITFSILNCGYSPIVQCIITINGQSDTISDLELHPNQKMELSTETKIPDTFDNLVYTIETIFSDESSVKKEDEIVINYPDIGISKAEIIWTEKGIRRIAVHLYNENNVSLEHNRYEVCLGAYRDVAHSELMEEITFQSGTDTITINEEKQLQAIDNGTFTVIAEFDVERYLMAQRQYEEEPEEYIQIPDNGIYIYFYTYIRDTNGDNDNEIVPEFNMSNNEQYVVITKTKDNQVLMMNEIVNKAQNEVVVQLYNTSIREQSPGRLIGLLLDQDHIILERKEMKLDPQDQTAEYWLEGEEKYQISLQFKNQGNQILTEYVQQQGSDLTLELLYCSGLDISLEDFKQVAEHYYQVTVPSTPFKKTQIVAEAKNPNAIILIDGNVKEEFMPYQEVEITTDRSILVMVITKDQEVQTTYELSITTGYNPIKPEQVNILTTSDSTVMVETKEGQEYAIAITDSIDVDDTSWQDLGTFQGLQPYTSYYVYTRKKETSLYRAGIVSDSLRVVTNHMRADSKLCYVDNMCCRYRRGSARYIQFNPVGDGMQITDPIEGDTRFRPNNWEVRIRNRRIVCMGDSDSFIIYYRGRYVLELNFLEEEYCEEMWKVTGNNQILSIPFNIL